jgi:hypothetical protein
MAAKRQYHIQNTGAELTALNQEATASAKQKVVERVTQPSDKAKTNKLTAGEALKGMFNVMSLRGDEFAALVSNNNENSAYDKLLYKDPTQALDTSSWYQVRDMNLYQNFVEENDLQPYLRKYYKDAPYKYTLGSGYKISMSLNDIVAIYCNNRASNTLMGGFKLHGKQEVNAGQVNDADVADIASVIDNPQSEQAQAIVQQMDADTYAKTQLVAEFSYNYFNKETYDVTIKIGNKEFAETNVPGPKTRLNAAGQMLYGLNRAISGEYFPTVTLTEKAARKASKDASPKTSIQYTKTGAEVKVDLPNVMELIERHGYETAHEVAYGEYSQELTRMMYSADFGDNTLLRTAEKTHGEQYKIWLEKYREHTFELKPADTSDLGRIANFFYNNVKSVRMASPSVWLKQPTAAVYAAAYLDVKHLPSPAQVATPMKDAQYQTMIDEVPQLIMRSHGYGLKETTEAATSGSKIQELFAKPLIFFDIQTCYYLYKWSENQAKAEMAGQEQDAVNKRTGELMRDVLNKSQATYAPHTTSMLGQEGGGTRVLTMFGTQTNSMLNTMHSATMDFQTGNGKRGMKKIVAILGSMAAAWGVDELRELLFPYQSDDDTLVDKVTNSTVFEIVNQFAGLFYGVRNVFSFMQYKDLNIPVLDELTDFTESLINTINYFDKAGTAETEEDRDGYVHDAIGNIKNMVLSFCNLSGVPVKNFEKYLLKPVISIGGQEAVTAYDNFFGYNTRAQDSYEGLSGALTDGNTELARQYIQIIINKGGDVDKFLKAKTGGAELSTQQQYELTKLWSDVQLEMSLSDVAGGE